MDIVKNHPYRLCEMTGIGFATADRIAASMGISPLSPERVDEGLLYTLIDAEGHGNLCLEKHAFIGAAVKLLETDGLTSEMVVTRAGKAAFRREAGQLSQQYLPQENRRGGSDPCIFNLCAEDGQTDVCLQKSGLRSECRGSKTRLSACCGNSAKP